MNKKQAELMAKIVEETGTRFFTITRAAVNEKDRTVEIAFSSEDPYKRWWGTEILDHSPGAVRLGRLNDGAPLLVEHDPKDHVGVIEEARIDPDRRGRAKVRFGKGARAEEVFRDVVEGIKPNVSVGYRIHKLLTETVNGGEPGEGEETFRAVDWEPYEISFVAVPADATVGLGKSAPLTTPTMEDRTMKKKVKGADGVEIEIEVPDEPVADLAGFRNGVDTERERGKEIDEIGKAHGMEDAARDARASGKTVDQFRKECLDRLGRRGGSTDPMTPPEIPAGNQAPALGMDRKDLAKFSFLRAIRRLTFPTDSEVQKETAFEGEVSAQASKLLGRSPQGLFVPDEVLRFRPEGAPMRRDLLAGTGTAGGYMVSDDLLAGSFIDLLRNKALTMQLATVIAGLKGDILIPRLSAGATAYWLSENADITESQQTLAQLALSPKTVGALTEFSRKLMLQSSVDVEALVKSDLSAVVALAVDAAVINGSGAAGQPLGILGTSGIGDVAGGTNGLAPAWSHVVSLEREVAIDNADVGRLAYLTNAKVRGKLKTVEMGAAAAGNFVWKDGATPINGYAAPVTNQVPSNLTKGTSSGVCSAILFGNWADLIIALWSGLDLMVDPYTGSAGGRVRVTCLQDVDLGIRHVESFAAMKDALTT